MPKQNWQVRIARSILGYTLAGVRRGSRGEWLHPDKAPVEVRQFWLWHEDRPLHGALTLGLDPQPNGAPWGGTWAELRALILQHNPDCCITRPDSYGMRVARAFDIKPEAQPHSIVTVDLKWSLWAALAFDWEDYAPGVVARMRAAFEGTGPAVLVRTAPRKEIRYGSVFIHKGRADVDFYCVWDESNDLVPESITDDAARDDAAESIGRWFEDHDESGDNVPCRVIETVRARTFERLMLKVDQCETRLLKEEEEQSQRFHEFLATL